MSSVLLLSFVFAAHPWLPPYGIDRVGQGDAELQADVRFDVTPRVNPADLGCILPPHDWILLGPGQNWSGGIAAFSKTADLPGVIAEAMFESSADQIARTPLPLSKGQRIDKNLNLPPLPEHGERDSLWIRLVDRAGTALWMKSIPVMFVRTSPKLPSFGATRIKLRYDAPISVRRSDGSFSSMSYDAAWPQSLDDIVVTLPSGGRFVFWRGSSYVPFWAGDRNTGLSYEWAETTPPKDGFADCVEPLMDKELRYGRVEILESTAARVRVKWTYQSCDFLYKVWGDTAEEVFTFYPDGYGTRTLTIQSALDGDYELSEFIILTPQGAYPFEVLPNEIVTILFGDGTKYEMPVPVTEQLPARFPNLSAEQMPAVYRVKLHKNDPRTAIYFNAQDRQLPTVAFAGFQDAGQTVTPCYWGSHWPLARGQTTGGAINDRIHASPGHNSLLSWAMQRPAPLRESTLVTLDSLGRSKPMRRQTWTWLIGLTDADDVAVRNVAASFAAPPEMSDLTGCRLDAETWAPERRALRLVAERSRMEFTLTPEGSCVNPVFEFAGLRGRVEKVTVDGLPMEAGGFSSADGVLWIRKSIEKPVRIGLETVSE